MTDQSIIFITFGIYLVLIFTIGWIGLRRTQCQSDYILGGRKLGKWTTAISAGASDMSGWLLLGLPGYAYLAGLEAIWIAIGLYIGTCMNWYFVAPRLRVQTQTLNNALTVPEYLEYRFNDSSHLLRLVSAIFILIFYFFYTSSGLVAGGKLFESVFGLSYQWAVIIGALTILIYTCLGGFLAVSWTDLIQGLLMALALSYVAFISIYSLHGFEALFNWISIINTDLVNPFTSITNGPLGFIGIISLLAWGLGYFGQPHILVRFMAIKSEKMIPQARTIAIYWTAIGLISALLIGFAGIALLGNQLQASDSEKVFIELLQLLLHPLPAGICLAAILAAIMSTADSQLLVASSALTEDIYKIINIKVTDKQLMLFGRVAVVVLTLFATALALQPDNNVLDLVAYAWAGFGATFGPVILLSLYWKNMSRNAALVGMLTGGITVIVWKNITSEYWLFDLYELVPGFVLAVLAILICQRTHTIFNRN
ncbi:MAG: sodium/proline symporter PutP [Proteobacteria bacterium]|nr:sodium/proline symporter PutP [Pseudomonadota bacterium]NOG59144.1 sodium/proline symporter PutP [Pseudomonadota bacterium]